MAEGIEYRQEVVLLNADRQVVDVLDVTNSFKLDLVDLSNRYGQQVAFVEVHGFERVNGQDMGRLFRGAVIRS